MGRLGKRLMLTVFPFLKVFSHLQRFKVNRQKVFLLARSKSLLKRFLLQKTSISVYELLGLPNITMLVASATPASFPANSLAGIFKISISYQVRNFLGLEKELITNSPLNLTKGEKRRKEGSPALPYKYRDIGNRSSYFFCRIHHRITGCPLVFLDHRKETSLPTRSSPTFVQ